MALRHLNLYKFKARVATSIKIPRMEADLMKRFGHTLTEATAIMAKKRRRAGRMRAARYSKLVAPKGGKLR